MTTCSECGQTVSTLAAACPKCGAPVAASASPAGSGSAPVSWTRLGGIALGTFAVGAVLFTLALTNVHEPKTATDHTQTQSARTAPKHNYVAIVRGYFGYRAGLSDNDRANGLASTPLTLVRYQGKRGNEYSFSVSDGGPYADLVTCTEPCELAQTMGMGGNKVFQVQPGTILGDIIDDARNGLLDSAAPAPQTSVAPPSDQPAVAATPDGVQEAIQAMVRQGLPDPSGWSEDQMNEQFRCPETLTSDDQQKASVAQTVVWYGKHHNPVTAEGIVEFRRQLLVSHNCTRTLASMARSGG